MRYICITLAEWLRHWRAANKSHSLLLDFLFHIIHTSAPPVSPFLPRWFISFTFADGAAHPFFRLFRGFLRFRGFSSARLVTYSLNTQTRSKQRKTAFFACRAACLLKTFFAWLPFWRNSLPLHVQGCKTSANVNKQPCKPVANAVKFAIRPKAHRATIAIKAALLPWGALRCASSS